MKRKVVSIRSTEPEPLGLAERLGELIIGQSQAIEAIVPYIQLFEANLAPEGRPVGVFLLLGPTGTGKTRTVEALAEVLHGSDRHVLRIDCGEFQLEHEVAKLIGAPPGYLGHRETQPMISQQKLNATASERSGLSIVLFDEIEKAAPSMGRLLLGVLDKAQLKLGDNTTVNFDHSLIFLTSNVGASEMMQEVRDRFGFAAFTAQNPEQAAKRLEAIGCQAVRKRFSPEFVNRIDHTLTYRPLTRDNCDDILDIQIDALAAHIRHRMGLSAFFLDVQNSARDFLLDVGTSPEFGARELKRSVHRHLMQPIARLVTSHVVPPGSILSFEAGDGALVSHVFTAQGVRKVG